MTSRSWLRTLFRSKSRVRHRLKEQFGELPESPPRFCPAALFSCYTARIPPVEREQAICCAGGVLANNDSSGLAIPPQGSQTLPAESPRGGETAVDWHLS